MPAPSLFYLGNSPKSEMSDRPLPTQVYVSVGTEETFVAAGRNPFSHFSRIESAAGADKLFRVLVYGLGDMERQHHLRTGFHSDSLVRRGPSRQIALRRLRSKCEAAVGPLLRSGRLPAAN